MKKTKIFAAFALAMSSLLSCSEDEKLMFDTNYAALCFYTDTLPDKLLSYKDSAVTFTFAYLNPDITNYDIPVTVEVTGMPADRDRTFGLSCDKEETTAQEGVNYQPLEKQYVMPAGSTKTNVLLRVLRTEDIQDKQLQIVLKVEQCADFPDAAIYERSKVKIKISDKLEKPSWWDAWKSWFGKFSREKYQQWIMRWGIEGLDPDGPGSNYSFSAPDVALVLSEMRDYFNENPTYDEDGELITLPIIK